MHITGLNASFVNKSTIEFWRPELPENINGYVEMKWQTVD